jgi:hypothetical protein
MPFLELLKKWWVLVAAFVALILAGGEMRYEVRQIKKDQNQFKELADADKLMREILGAHASSIVAQRTKIEEMQTHMSPSAIQKWGQVQADVTRHERKLEDLEDQIRELR